MMCMSSFEGECLHVHEDTPSVPWVVDSGASFHATPNKEFFSTYRSGEFEIVKMGNEGYSKIAGVGDVCLETDLGNKLMLKDVRHVPGLRLNLMSRISSSRRIQKVEAYQRITSGG